MALTIIRVFGASNTGKSSTIRAFVAEHFGLGKEYGDVRAVFQMSRRGYALGVSSAGDNVGTVNDGLEFLKEHKGIRAMIVACHTEKSATYKVVTQFANHSRAIIRGIPTHDITGKAAQKRAILSSVREIGKKLP